MRQHLAAILAGIMAMAAPSASAQNWPARQQIKVVLPLSAGSATDVVARIVLDQVSKQIGQTIIVDNRVGAAGTIGVAAVAKSDPDGYTILVNSSSQSVYPSTFLNPGFNVLKDFSAIAPIASVPTVLVVNPSKGYKSVADFVAAAKAKPGEMNFASAGIGNSTHLAAERFNMSAGVKAVHIPFKGAPESIAEVMGGRVDYYFSPLPAAVSLIKDGKLQALAVGSSRRSSLLPNLPTTIEAGFPDSNYEFWVGAFVPSATPRDIVERLGKAVGEALQNEAVKKKLSELGADPMPMSPQQFDAYLKTEVDLNATLVKAAGIKPN